MSAQNLLFSRLPHLFGVFFLLTSLKSFSQAAPTTLWAKHPDGHLAPYTSPDISADGNGNTYVTGGFDGTLTFPTSPSPTVLTSAGESDIFIAKYDATGNVLWAKRAGGTHGDLANSIKYDGFGNIYVVGSYTESANFGSTTLTSPETIVNVFIAKYNGDSGEVIWAEQGVGIYSATSTALDVAVDKTGAAYITGQFVGNITFAPLSTLSTSGWWDIFAVKYNSDGVAQWQTVAGSINAGYNLESGNGIAVDESGNVFVTGRMNGSATYPTMFGTIPLVSNGDGGFYETDYFLAKYNPSTSSWEWAVNGGGTVSSPYSNDYGTTVSLDNSGGVYVSGVLNSETSSFGTVSITEQGGKGYFIAKYSNHGNLSWIHPTPGIQYNARNSSKVDANGNFYFAGTFGGSITIGDQNLTSNGYDNVYLSAWNTNGEFQWVKHIPGDYYSQISALEIEGNGNIDITTVFAGTETFDCTTFGSGSYADLAIAKLGYASGSTVPTIQASANNICSGNGTILNIANGNLNNATGWRWYTGSCGGTSIGSGSSITVSPIQNTTYYVRSEGGCAGPGNCGSITVSVSNTSPVINSITGPVAPVAINNSINLMVDYTGTNVTTAKIKWDDLSAEQIISNPASNFTVPHTYNAPGVYTVTVSLIDACGHNTSSVYQYIVVYDPNGGFVTGGGWMNSPAGAYRPDVILSGKAIFGFESKYQKGTTIPSGNTEFKFQAGSMNFKSSVYEWLVVSGSKGQFKGTGTINGSGSYGFLLSAVDGDLGTQSTPDLFRIKIWDKNSNDAIVYDNQYATADNGALTTQIGGGSIIIHNPKAGEASSARYAFASPETYSGALVVAGFPNPSVNHFTITSKSSSPQPLFIKVTDVLGRIVEIIETATINNPISVGKKYLPGVYFVEVKQGKTKQILKLIKGSQ